MWIERQGPERQPGDVTRIACLEGFGLRSKNCNANDFDMCKPFAFKAPREPLGILRALRFMCLDVRQWPPLLPGHGVAESSCRTDEFGHGRLRVEGAIHRGPAESLRGDAFHAEGAGRKST